MSNRFFESRLERKLALSIIISLAISVSVSLLINFAGNYALDKYYDKSSFLQNKSIQAISDFKTYVSANNISADDHEKIEKWSRSYKYVDIYIFKNNTLVYNSTRYSSYSNYENLAEISIISSNYNIVSFADGNANVYMDCYFEYKYYYITLFISSAIGLIIFVSVMLTLIKRKVSYIGKLENEIKILEGGDLNYNITIEGNDELSSLAESINEMRKSFMERLHNESEAEYCNSELITAMSHDLRTPLTALLGYLEIIEYKKYKTEEDLMQYIHNSREKTYQIKTLSDKLFEYFLVFNRRDDLDLELFNANEILDQLFQEEFFMLSDENFTFDFISYSDVCYLDMNLISIRRVFDNIFSNISKYADLSEPVKIRYYTEGSNLIITIKNKISKNRKSVTSTGIGLKTCNKIIEMHKGTLYTENINNLFVITIILPIKII